MAEILETEEKKTISNWDDMDLKEDILRGIYRCGFEKPTPIQTMAILPIINRRDIIAQAQSGTGKTGSFSSGSLQIINTNEYIITKNTNIEKLLENIFI